MLARWTGTGIIAALLAPATVASAQTAVPDLKGSWSGTALRGRRARRPDCQTVVCKPPVHDHDWRASDPLIGRIRSDRRRLHMVDNDGTLTGELLGPDEMEVCRTEVTPRSMNVYCATLTRKR
jgi:hypothetical protein